MEKFLICTNRLQPLHLGHVQFWMEIRKRYKEHLIICILRRSQQLESVRVDLENSDPFESLSRLANAVDRVPLPNWERLRLTSLAVASEPLLAKNSTVLLRDRPDRSWEASVEDLPKNRAWVFNVAADASFSQAKLDFYTSKGEEVIEVNVPRHRGYEGMRIREAIRTGNHDLSFLPPACHDYFRTNCLHYFGIGAP